MVARPRHVSALARDMTDTEWLCGATRRGAARAAAPAAQVEGGGEQVPRCFVESNKPDQLNCGRCGPDGRHGDLRGLLRREPVGRGGDGREGDTAGSYPVRL